MNKILSNILSSLLGICLFVFLVWKVGINQILATFHNFSFFNIFFIVVLGFLLSIPPALVWNNILKLNGIYIRLKDAINTTFAGEAISYITPSAYFGGEPVKAWILKRIYGTETDCALSTIFTEKFLRISNYFFAAMIGILFIFTVYYLPPGLEVLLAIAVSISVLVYLFFFATIFSGKGVADILIKKLQLYRFNFIARKQHKISNFDRIFSDFFYYNKKQAIKQFFFSMPLIFIVILRYYVILRAFGYTPSFFEVFMMFSAGVFAVAVPLLPGSLGVFEVIMVFMTTLFYGNPSLGLAFAFMIRFSDLPRVGYGLICFIIYKIKLSHKK